MTNKLIVPNADLVLNQLKNEIVAELGIELGAEQTARMNGIVGGEITKRLIALGMQQLQEQGIKYNDHLQTNQNQGIPPENKLH